MDKVREDRLYSLIQALQAHAHFGHPVEQFEILQTHISYVLLTGPYAYKFKKPVDLGFLDYSTLEKRRFYCEEEIRLNRRLAPTLYLEVVPVTGQEAAPILGGAGPVIEYCVKMRQFPQNAQLDQVLERGELTPCHIDDIATQVATFHKGIAIAARGSVFGTPTQIAKYALENFEQIGPGPKELPIKDWLAELHAWTLEHLAKLDSLFRERKHQGQVRECHGDMHLANMALSEEQVIIFDCIEFNPALYWIDVMSEIAFLLMDLDYRDRCDLGYRFLNRYLEWTGDYDGLALLDFYRAYRSMVRAKVAYIQYQQEGGSEALDKTLLPRFLHHIELARRYTRRHANTPLVITHGLSGAGKTYLTERLVECMGAIRLRSDVERKRLWGLEPQAQTNSRVNDDLYQPGITERTYKRLRALAQVVLRAGFPVIVDATFLKCWQRDMFRQLADELKVPFCLLEIKASEAMLRERIRFRQGEAVDASEATPVVLDYQLATRQSLRPDEAAVALSIDMEVELNIAEIAERIMAGGLAS